MKKNNWFVVLVVSVLFSSVSFAGDCAKTLMGNDCSSNQEGVASHMRGNAVENAKASKALQEAKRKAKEKAISVGAKNKKNDGS